MEVVLLQVEALKLCSALQAYGLMGSHRSEHSKLRYG